MHRALRLLHLPRDLTPPLPGAAAPWRVAPADRPRSAPPRLLRPLEPPGPRGAETAVTARYGRHAELRRDVPRAGDAGDVQGGRRSLQIGFGPGNYPFGGPERACSMPDL